MEMRGIYITYIEQIIYENTHIQQLMFNKKVNEAKQSENEK